MTHTRTRTRTRRRPRQLNRVGLLFVSTKTYESRIWDAAYQVAVDNYKTPSEAIEIADDALKAAKANNTNEASNATHQTP